MDINVYDNYTSKHKTTDISKYTQGIIDMSSMIVIVCQGGSAKYKFHYNEYNITRGAMIMIPPGVTFKIIESDKDYVFDAMRIGQSLFRIVDEITVRPQFEHILGGVPILRLNDVQLQMGHSVFNYIHELITKFDDANEDEKSYIKQIVEGYLRVMLLEACHMISMKDRSLKSHTRQDIITQKFFKELAKNFKNRETVAFYGRQVGVTPKKLSYLVKEQTGKTAAEWIDKFSLLEAKKMLKTMDMTIQEISFDLNFATPSHFTKFFKQHCGMTPSEFRHNSE